MSLIDLDIQDVISKAIVNDDRSIKVIIRNSLEDFEIDDKFLVFLEIDRDYMRNKTDFMRLCFQYPAGSMMKDFYAHRNNLEVILTYRNVLYNEENKPEVKDLVRTYKAIIINSDGGSMNPEYMKADPQILDKGNMSIITLQLVDRIYEVLRPIPLELNRRHASMTDVLGTHMKTVITEKEVLIEDEQVDLTIDVVEAHNNVELDNVRYEQKDGEDVVRVMRLGNYLQEEYGVYNSGIGCYLQHYRGRDILFYYPLADITRFNKEKDKLIILIPVKDGEGMIDSNYVRDGDVLKIIVDPNIKDYNPGDKPLRESGAAVAGVDPNHILSGNMVDNVVATPIAGLEDGSAPTVFVGSEGNLYKHRSNIILNNLIVFNFTWRHGNPDEIFPGMPVKVIQEQPYDEITGETKPYLREYNGSVVTTFTAFNCRTRSITTNISVMVGRPRKLL